MTKTSLLIFTLLGLFSACAGQFLQSGQCDPNIQIATNLDLNEFLGTWYEIARSENPLQTGGCSSLQFSRQNNESNTLNAYRYAVVDNFLDESNGTAVSTNGTARFTLNFPFYNALDFWILLTDHSNFALAYSCENVNTTFRNVYIWQFGRQTTYPNEMIPALMNTTINNLLGINASDLESVSHTDTTCYVLPVIQSGQPIILTGQCDANIPVVQNFDVPRFLGVWHEISSYYSESATGSCPRAEYTLGNGVVNVVNSQVVNQRLDTITGTAAVNSTDGSARLLVTLNLNGGVTAQQDLWILATDYEDYAISYSCTNLPNNQKRVFSWILSRNRQLTANATVQVNQVVNSIMDLNNRYFTQSNRSDSDCFYYPIAAPNQAVIFRGQCSDSIPVVQNFDATRYLGLWHDIESYPAEFQDGNCSNAYYSLSSEGVDVFNTQVINQSLDTINAIAVVASTDGSAKLNVTFPVAGTNLTIQTEYWIVATDYTSYSLVYSCRNISGDQRQVSSWKLSRTKQLTAAATTAINTAMNTIDVLDQQYYVPVDQSTEGCFYFPEPELGKLVVFPGQCDENIAAVANFNLNQFQGQWFEIDAYPKDQQPGQCIGHQFSVASVFSFNLVSTNVYDQFQGVTNSIVSRSVNEATGRFTVTLTTNGTTISFPYWILSTDYTSYALAYSCVNINSDFRGIYSWKLSRTRSLTAQAVTAINNAIAPIEVLDNVYYESIDQSDDACFYLPEIGPGQPIVLIGQCDPNITVVQNFDAGRYLGRWRLIEGYPSDSQEGTCEEANYSLGPDGSVVVFNTEVRNQSLSTITGTAVLATTDGSGKLTVTFPDIPIPFEYWILDTDYDSYALVYGCVNINTQQRRIWSWKMSRTNTLTQTANTAINQVINTVQVLNNRYYQTIDRSDAGCFYFPMPGTEAVVFRGQCDQSIAVVQNFDAVRYMGLWHDVESYPAEFQDGTCSNAYYTLSDNGVDVYNTQVINQRLDTINGLATLATTDGSAKLLVTFPVAGTNFTVQTDYWVLATDYTSYSLVYSCRNLNSEERQVTSWKLSRTKQLTAAALTAINNTMNTVDVVDQRYFRNMDQSPEGCFYFPEPQLDVAVVFPGQCDTTVPVVQNFNFTQFAGVWHEIQAYPKDDEPGQCVNHQFSVTGTNGFNLISTSVVNQFLGVTNSAVTSVANDGAGRFTITLNTNGTVITIPYWIVATDYTNYALAYSCVNINNDFRGVWSWKLSRTQSLTAAANTAINNAIAPIVVLDNVYYENIDQSADACFYLPDIPAGEPVILPGQCDPNITVVQNFDAARYLGRWRLIEGYASDSQGGTCEEANYSLGPNGNVVVFNTEVRNQSLETITGEAVLATTDGSGKLSVTFPNIPGAFEYWILDTDYDSFALVYGCVNVNNNQRRVWSWKMSRTNTLTANATNTINQIINGINVLNNRYYQLIDRSDDACFYFPEPSSDPVVFRGQCNENITVVQNFDAARYMGLWHEIERYPAVFQSGSCSNAFYSLSGNGVDVYNTQVINQTLDTINGFATLATTDGSAKLIVTFPVAGTNLTVQTEYWVLATDYSSYSLVYSCRNLNEEQRQVTSWKLGRAKQLTTAAITAINNAINIVDVIDPRYFLSIDQSAEGCFYYPNPQVGVPVVFPGQCDTAIPVVQNFNMSQFQGVWHEIEAYPKIDQPGQCINHDFTQSATNSLSLVSSNVLDQVLGVSTGTVTFSSNDLSARLTITLSSNGTVITIPYWIVATDYTNYALAYSCVNQNNDFRGVWSWKLSRTKQLTAASNQAINTTMANIDVLEDRYYEPINQTDGSCFYLPDLAPGEPVIFVGQCANLTVMQNFDATRYVGRWNLIETYPSDFQVGECNDATYSLNADGSVLVYNTEVVNETLSTMTGTAVLATTDGSGKLIVNFPSIPATLELWILDTDYETYSLVYSCANQGTDRRHVWSWKMSRTNVLTANAVNAISQVVNRVNVLDDRYFQTVNRSDAACFYYPTPGSTPLRFRGQCDQNIPVVQNFNAVRYTGLWHDIESYPAPFQMGTCSNAEYTLNADGTVFVYNTQVVNQVLDVMTGTAVLASTDGSARLRVTFLVGGVNVTTDYWVLATDYDSYAFVYSCVNVNTEYREVFSWKLSRQQNLTATANTAINSVINSVQVLRQDYYIDRDQSEEGCFYYPDNFGGDVILSGQCLESNLVQAVTNFNTSRFAGTWNEVARFPSALQDGECAASEYVLNNQNSFSVTNTIVKDERQSATLIPSAIVSSDGRAIISASVSGVPIDSIYILATDYSEYALAYSCRNINATSKQIYSWKLSRSRAGLSAAANNAIDTVVTNNRDLFEGYYSSTSQTNEACFYYPVFDQLPAFVTLPGPCNETIRGFPNFNSSAYLGRWLEMARYPQPTQQGQCNRVYYTSGNSVINVANTQVTNQVLFTQEGTAVPISTDGSALWNVTLNLSSGPTTVSYYVLATDYTSYALVYSCRNLEDGNRLVGSWKFSRTTTLSTEANSIMDSVINNTQGLLEDYYRPTSQSVADCFFVPELNPSEAPLLRGQCEEVTGVANFAVNSYLGWWHEIERYPSDNNVGECISTNYELSGNVVNVVDTSVTNNNATVVTGTVVASADGRLRRTLANGQVQDIWVLDTDYNNYALLYSCENVGDEFKRVWSAKHSKARQLTQAAQNAMAPTIEANVDLFQHLYLPVDQNGSTCFHYPVQTGEQVIIPGQCDEGIPLVQNFDITAYAGTWYQTERYDPISENVSCVGARYTVNTAADSIEILNWEVRSGVLETSEASATIASTDGSGKLYVTGNNNKTITLYVLSTDYENYALTYTCVNVNSYQRAVGAWKLSRDRTMPAVGTTAINAYMAQRQELHQPYFSQVAQSEDCEEPSSAFLAKSSIIVIFVCIMLQKLL